MGKAGKGYKKPKQKKYITKRDTIITALILVVILAVVAVIAVQIHNDDFIRKKDGKYAIEKNWIVANFSKTSTYKLYKIGEVGEMDGYELQDSSENSLIKYIHPVDEENADIEFAYIGSVTRNYKTIMESLKATYSDLAEPVYFTCAGRDAVFSYYQLPDDSSDEESAETADDAETAAEAADDAAEEELIDYEAEGAVIAASGDPTASKTLYNGFAYIQYDEERSVYIQLMGPKMLTEAEAQAIYETIGNGITLIDR